MQHLSDDFIKQWQHIINSVDKTEFPLTTIKKVSLKLTGNRKKTINIDTLRKQGLDEEEIEATLSRRLSELEEELMKMEFVVDVEQVAKIVQSETDRILKDL